MVIRRKVFPYIAHTIWDGIRNITHQRKLANEYRLTKYIQKLYPNITQLQADDFVRECVEEGIIIPATKGYGPQSYVLPNTSNVPTNDGHDWYCFECHLPGDVEFCQSCHRVYHRKCWQQAKKIQQNVEPPISFGLGRPKASKLAQEEGMVIQVLPTDVKVVLPDCLKVHNVNKTEEAKECDLQDSIRMDVTVDECVSQEKGEATTKDSFPSSAASTEMEVFKCVVCKLIEADTYVNIDQTDLNYISNFVFDRIKNWLSPNILTPIVKDAIPPWEQEGDEVWRGQHLLYQPMDVHIMEVKAQNGEYTVLNQIHADVLTIRHNVSIYHGVYSAEVQGADYMIQDACHDIGEIRRCIDCYRNSNEKRNNRWFCFPCKTPHQLVWAKQKGFSFWPAKVIRKLDRQYDVRFFGNKYLRAIIEQNSVKPIETPFSTLKIKRTPSFNKAYAELQLHQRWLQNPVEVDLSFSSAKKKLKSSPTKSVPKKVSTSHKRNSNFSENEKNARTKQTDGSNKKRKSEPEPAENERLTRAGFTKHTSSLEIGQRDESSHSQEDLISSTQDIRPVATHPTLSVEQPRLRGIDNSAEKPPTLHVNRSYTETCERLRRRLETCHSKEEMIQIACDTLQDQNERYCEKIRNMVDSQSAFISDLKKKQWCFICEQEAIYHCCWNTSYCSTQCQQHHWQNEHKKFCRRKCL